MGKGSQLTQLKSALSQAGVTGKPSTNKKRKRNGTPLAKEKEKRAARLEEIHRQLNPFDIKVTKLKHDVGGRKIKGTTGKPAQSKQAGIEQRKKTLLKEWEERNRAGGVVDRRFGENDPSMSLEERMLERFTREHQRASKATAFNLEDEDELTHYGQSLSKLDDFDNIGLGLDSEDEEESGQIHKDIVTKAHFGGFEDDEAGESEEPPRKKTKAEVMAEIVAKSKEHKLIRQLEKEQDENIRHELDNEFMTLRDLLYAPDLSFQESDKEPTRQSEDQIAHSHAVDTEAKILSLVPEIQDADYDRHVRELAFDKRSKPKDRTKTEEELALEEKEALEKAEKQRRKRMLGIEDDEIEEEGKSKRKRKRGGDDLEDDFDEDEKDGWAGLGAGLGIKEVSEHGDEGGETSEGSSGIQEDGDDEGNDTYNFDEGDRSAEDEEGEQENLTSSSAMAKLRNRGDSSRSVGELPYTFPAPVNHDQFLEIVMNVAEKDVPIVVHRIRTLYHTSLAPDNKFKLQTLANVLIDHILHITSLPNPRFGLVSSLLPHLVALVKAYPLPAAEYFKEKLTLMQKNLKRGLSHAKSSEAKTWPGSPELTLLRTIGLIWPSSDFNHAVISPARVLMGAYLGLGRIRSLNDIASGLFLCTLFLQYESLSKRFVPEAINFLVNAFLHLTPKKYDKSTSLLGSFPLPDYHVDTHGILSLKTNKYIPTPQKPNLPSLLALEKPSEQAKVELLSLSFDLLGRFADMYKGLDGFIELYEPLLKIVQQSDVEGINKKLQSQHSQLVDMLVRLVKFAKQSRRFLALQAHKPIPIPTYIPKFETPSSNYLRKQDPDRERNEAAKLRYQLKQEKKGAIRELRKDARFLAAVQQKQQLEKDEEYNRRMKKAFTSIESERAEQKAMEREKTKEKRRAGRK